MRRIDPNYLLDKIKVRDDCPSDIKYLTRWIKAMVLFQDVDLIKDEEKLVKFFFTWVNKSSPQKVLFGLEMTEEQVRVLVRKARDWLLTKEVLE